MRPSLKIFRTLEAGKNPKIPPKYSEEGSYTIPKLHSHRYISRIFSSFRVEKKGSFNRTERKH